MLQKLTQSFGRIRGYQKSFRNYLTFSKIDTTYENGTQKPKNISLGEGMPPTPQGSDGPANFDESR